MYILAMFQIKIKWLEKFSYIRTSGEEANGLSNFSFSGILVDNNNVSVADGISLITTITASESGKAIESVDSVKNYATKIYASQNRAVTAADYEALIPKIYPETQSVSVFGGETLSPPQFGKVFITIKPFFGPFVPNSIKDNLKNILRRYSVAGIVPEILDLKYLYIETDSTVYYNENLAPGSDFVKSIVSTNVDNYSNSTELNKYGARFKYSRFQNIIDNSHESITSNITKVQIRRDMKAKLNQLANYEICFGNEFYIKRLDGFNIKSSGFRVFGVDDVVYLGDVPNQDQVTGEIFLFKLNSPTQPGIVRRSVGTINYQKGEILLDNINIVSTSKTVQRQPIIEISACPRSNDVIGLQDLYLQLNTSNSVLNMLSDEVASGADPSGTTYITTSSYTNGNLVRS